LTGTEPVYTIGRGAVGVSGGSDRAPGLTITAQATDEEIGRAVLRLLVSIGGDDVPNLLHQMQTDHLAQVDSVQQQSGPDLVTVVLALP